MSRERTLEEFNQVEYLVFSFLKNILQKVKLYYEFKGSDDEFYCQIENDYRILHERNAQTGNLPDRLEQFRKQLNSEKLSFKDTQASERFLLYFLRLKEAN